MFSLLAVCATQFCFCVSISKFCSFYLDWHSRFSTVYNKRTTFWMSAGITSHQFYFCSSCEDAAERVTFGCKYAEKLLMLLAGLLLNWQPTCSGSLGSFWTMNHVLLCRYWQMWPTLSLSQQRRGQLSMDCGKKSFSWWTCCAVEPSCSQWYGELLYVKNVNWWVSTALPKQKNSVVLWSQAFC